MFFQLLILASVAALVVSGASFDDCPRHLLEYGVPRNLRVFGQSCYTFHPHRTQEFWAAEDFCKLNGGHLVKIPDLQTQNFLYSTMWNSFGYHGGVWIGLSDREAESHFCWMDGSSATYTNWVPGQPDSVWGFGGSLQDCVYMDLGDRGRWRDDRCKGYYTNSFLIFSTFHPRSRPFICEYPVIKHTTPTTTTTTTTTKQTTPQPATTRMIPSSSVETTQQPTTQQPTTQQPNSQQPNSQQPTTTAEKSTTPPPTPTSATPQPTTTTGTTTTAQKGTTPGAAATTTPIPSKPSTSVSTTGCPPFRCTNDCGLNGYAFDGNNCLTCDCNV